MATWTWTPPFDPARPAVVVGLMSGTSADGVDAACCRLSHPAGGPLEWAVLGTATRTYPDEIAARLREPESLDPARLAALNVRVGRIFGAAAADAARAAGLALEDVALVGSHGQTVWHDPRGATDGAPATLQIGEPAEIAAATGRPVWADFRPADVAAGGQGAPLVPFLDRLVLADPARWTVALNLGGIANVALVPPGGSGKLVGFDTGPGNMVLDHLARRLLGTAHDADGRVAAGGRPDRARLEAALADPYFGLVAPKSTGREGFGAAWTERRFGPLDGLAEEAIGERLATAVELTVESVARALEGQAGTGIVPPDARVVVSGGGRRNRTLMKRLAERLAPRDVLPIDDLGLDGDFKEAVAFAVLAYESALGRPTNVPSVTGAARPARLGKLAFPPE